MCCPGDWLEYLRDMAPGAALPPFAETIAMRLVYQEPTYRSILCNSKFTLTPAGDQPWSRRTYEAMLCCSIPIVQRREHVGRTEADLALGYEFYVYDASKPKSHYVYRRDWATSNWHKFVKHNTLLPPDEYADFQCPDRLNEAEDAQRVNFNLTSHELPRVTCAGQAHCDPSHAFNT